MTNEPNTPTTPDQVSDEALDQVVGGGPASVTGDAVKNPKRPGDGSVKPVTTGFADYGAGTTSL